MESSLNGIIFKGLLRPDFSSGMIALKMIPLCCVPTISPGPDSVRAWGPIEAMHGPGATLRFGAEVKPDSLPGNFPHKTPAIPLDMISQFVLL